MPTIFPELRWAQRSNATDPEKNKLWITIAVANVEQQNVETTETTFKFTGKDSEREYAVDLELYAEIDPKLTRVAVTGQNIVVELRKKEPKAEYWPRLTKDTKRRPFIRTDFDKWVDEDEQEEVGDADPMADLGAFGGAGGAGGAGGGFDMSQLAQLQEALGKSGGADMTSAAQLDDDDSSEENDETTTNLGEAQD